MKISRLFYVLWILWAVVVAACDGKKKKVGGSEPIMAVLDTATVDGIHRMQASVAETDITFEGKVYHSYILRTPDEALPRVESQIGGTCVDNKIELRLTRGGKKVFEHTFRKSDFASAIDRDFLSNAVLEGIVYDKTTPQGFVYAASVCYPQTDLYIPLSVTITAKGKMSFRKVELEESYLEGETD